MKTKYIFLFCSFIALTSCDFLSNSNQSSTNSSNSGLSSLFRGMNKSVEYIKLEDPQENAFSVEMPKGWNNQIGLVRVSESQTYTCGVAVSPDNKTRIFFGDPNIPNFTTPNPSIGLDERFSTATNRVMNYVPAEQFVANYTKNAFGKNEAFKIIAIRPNNERLQKIKNMIASNGMGSYTKAECVDVVFEYSQNGELYQGTVSGNALDLSSLWTVEVSGFTTPKSQFDDTREIIEAIAASLKTNPQWRQKQDQAFAARMQRQQIESNQKMQQLTAAHNQRMNDIQNSANAHQQRMNNLNQSYDQYNQSWQNQQNSLDDQHKRTIDMIREEQLVRGNNGQYGKVESGYDNYYVNPNNNMYFGTNTPLQTVPDNYEQWNKADYGE